MNLWRTYLRAFTSLARGAAGASVARRSRRPLIFSKGNAAINPGVLRRGNECAYSRRLSLRPRIWPSIRTGSLAIKNGNATVALGRLLMSAGVCLVAALAAEMRALGLEVTEKGGKTGLVATYKKGDGPTILARTELDALPMEEKTGLAYASRDKTDWNGQETFVDHSCGHDNHMVCWVGLVLSLLGLLVFWFGSLLF